MSLFVLIWHQDKYWRSWLHLVTHCTYLWDTINASNVNLLAWDQIQTVSLFDNWDHRIDPGMALVVRLHFVYVELELMFLLNGCEAYQRIFEFPFEVSSEKNRKKRLNKGLLILWPWIPHSTDIIHILERGLRRKSFENVSVVSEWPCERDFGVLATENRVKRRNRLN